MGKLSRIWRNFIVSFINTFLCGTHFFAVKRFLLNCCGIHVGEGTKIVAPFIVGNSSDISLGKDCWIGASFSIHGDGTVRIGDRCDFGPEISLLTGSHEIGTTARRAGTGITYTIIVGNGCWIGARATILGNVKLADSSVIAAASLVNKDVSCNVLVAGVPAKSIKTLG